MDLKLSTRQESLMTEESVIFNRIEGSTQSECVPSNKGQTVLLLLLLLLYDNRSFLKLRRAIRCNQGNSTKCTMRIQCTHTGFHSR